MLLNQSKVIKTKITFLKVILLLHTGERNRTLIERVDGMKYHKASILENLFLYFVSTTYTKIELNTISTNE